MIVAFALVSASGVLLLVAVIWSSGHEQIPDTTVEMVLWFALPLAAMAGAIVAVALALRLGEAVGRSYVLEAVASVTSLVAYYGYALLLTT